MKIDEARHKREIEFQLKQTQIENERRQQEKEHELKMFSLLMENKSTSNNRSFQGMYEYGSFKLFSVTTLFTHAMGSELHTLPINKQ